MKFSPAQPECYLDNLTETYLAFSHPDIDSGTQGILACPHHSLSPAGPTSSQHCLSNF